MNTIPPLAGAAATVEANFDGLVGPTHHYAGLSHGNLASTQHRGVVSNPRLAARQGLQKMKALADMGYAQGVLPPQERPHLPALRQLGFAGTDAQVLAQAAQQTPRLLSACSAASAMWAANAATVTPSADSGDGRVHFTPANLVSTYHRSLEAPATARILQAVFADPQHFAHHPPLPAQRWFADEGAANHTRLCAGHGLPGVGLFVYGAALLEAGHPHPAHYPARQTLEASQAIARQHGLAPERVVFAQQNPDAIDAGVFHNDVIAVGHGPLLLVHQRAYARQDEVLRQIDTGLAHVGGRLQMIEVPEAAVPLADAVASYLFNSQLLTRPDGRLRLVAPEECHRVPSVAAWLQQLLAANGPIAELHCFDLRQSMHNGGGPACLRLRVELSPAERAATRPGVWLDDALFATLNAWVDQHYRDRLSADDLADPALLQETRTALDTLTGLLKIGSVYAFQRG